MRAAERPADNPRGKELPMSDPERRLGLHLTVLAVVVVLVVAALIVEGLGFALIVAIACAVVLAIGYPLMVILAEGRDVPIMRRRS
jgi:type IV secretory pathway TrbD component